MEIAKGEEIETKPEESNIHTTECGRIFMHLEKNVWTFNCFFCESSFTEISEFIQHFTDIHIELLSDGNENEWDMVSSPRSGILDLEITPLSPKKEDEAVEGELVTRNGVEQHLTEKRKKLSSSGKSKCEICSKTFPCNARLRDHVRLHTGETPFKCDLCPKLFRSNNVLRFHRKTHLEDKSYECDHCDQTFSQKRYLTAHLKYISTEVKHTCKICGKTNRTNNQLKVHMAKHSSNKEHICEICGRCYTLRQHLVLHLKQQHENKRDFKCDKCDKAFNTLPYLKNHQLVHTKERNHICNVCGMEFIWRKNLSEHEKLHQDKKNYSCDICGKEFAQQSGHISHLKTHTNTPQKKKG